MQTQCGAGAIDMPICIDSSRGDNGMPCPLLESLLPDGKVVRVRAAVEQCLVQTVMEFPVLTGHSPSTLQS
ncbi:hypothetical protein H671_4g13144 [Cricetulus griseus]|uniref:Uncharacterized protein n=1 Tax=Cricetulus griseus TaxID=10029 RepID=A0A061I4X3_CRIGR|nr:hypothetical protein H671_4g13144 [Cricetulus griseus]